MSTECLPTHARSTSANGRYSFSPVISLSSRNLLVRLSTAFLAAAAAAAAATPHARYYVRASYYAGVPINAEDVRDVRATVLSRSLLLARDRPRATGGLMGEVLRAYAIFTQKVARFMRIPNVAVLTGHTGEVRSVAVLDARTIISGGDDGSVRVWEL